MAERSSHRRERARASGHECGRADAAHIHLTGEGRNGTASLELSGCDRRIGAIALIDTGAGRERVAATTRDTLGFRERMGCDAQDVSIKGKTNEGMGFIGRGEGLACLATAMLYRA